MRASAIGVTFGSRSGHSSDCRCLPCRAAIAEYERERKAAVREIGPLLVPAENAMLHLQQLKRQKIGLRAVADAADISVKSLRAIRSGEKTLIRRKNAERILAVDKQVIADHALVPAAKTWNQINELLEEGYSQQFLARSLGVRSGYLEFGQKRVLAKTAAKVDKLYRKCMF